MSEHNKYILLLSDGNVEVSTNDDFIKSSKLLTTMLKDLVDWEILENSEIPLKNVSVENFHMVKSLLEDNDDVRSYDLYDTAHMLNVCNFLDMEDIMDILIRRWIDLTGHMSDNELKKCLSTNVTDWGGSCSSTNA